MYGPKTKRLTVNISEELKAKIKAYASFSNIALGVFVNRVLVEKIKKIEMGHDKFIKIGTKK